MWTKPLYVADLPIPVIDADILEDQKEDVNPRHTT